MKILGSYQFAAPRQEVWEALLDPEVLSRTVPGSEGLEQTAENEFQGKLKMKVGPVQGLFQGKVKLEHLDPPNGYEMTIDGRGAPGFVKGTGVIKLSDHEGGTQLDYDVDAQVGGRIAGVGQRLLDSSAKVITRQALEALDAQIQARVGAGSAALDPPDEGASSEAGANGPAGGEASPAPTPAAKLQGPSQTEFAAKVARGVVDDLIPRSMQRVLMAVGAVVLLALLVLAFRGCG